MFNFSIQESCVPAGFNLSSGNVVVMCVFMWPKWVMSSMTSRSDSHWWQMEALADVTWLQHRQTVFCWTTLVAVPPRLVGSTAGGTCMSVLGSAPRSHGCPKGCARLLLWTPSSLQKPRQRSANQHCTTFWLCLIDVPCFLICQKSELIRQRWSSCSYLLKTHKKSEEIWCCALKPPLSIIQSTVISLS